MNFEFILAGLFVGTLVGLTGMGGGSLMTPILVLVLGIRPTIAVGTDLAYAAVTNAAGAWQHFRQGQVRFKPAFLLALGSIPSTLFGVGLIGHLRHVNGFNVDKTVGHALAIMLFVVAAMLMIQPFVNRQLWPRQEPTTFTRRLRTMRRYRPVILVGVGVVVGFLVGITSVGGGSLVMFSMLLLFPKWPMSQRVGTDVFQSFLLAAAAASAHLGLGDVSFPLAAQLLIGSVPGVLLGSRLTKRVPDRVLRPIVAGALALSAWRLL